MRKCLARGLIVSLLLLPLFPACNFAESEGDIARDIVECQMRNDPDRLWLMMLGGKEGAALLYEQISTREELLAEREAECSKEPHDETRQR